MLSMPTSQPFNFRRDFLRKFCFMAAILHAAPAIGQIDYSNIDFSKFEFDIVIYDAETIARINAPQLPQNTAPAARPVIRSTPEPQTITAGESISTSPQTPAAASSVQSTPVASSTQTAPTPAPAQTSQYPIDISAQYTEFEGNVPVIKNPQICGKGGFEIGVVVENVAKEKGSIVADLHDDVKENFLAGDKVVLRVRQTAQKGETRFCLPLTEPGEYAVAIYHDKNDNKKFDKNFLGIPSEHFGMSRNPKFGLKSPEYEETNFTVPEGGTNIRIKLFKASDIL